MTKEEHAKVLAALEAITKHFSISRLHESTLADTTVRGQAHEAIAIMRKEPQGWMPIETAPKDEPILVGPTKRMGICVAMNDSRDGWVTETCSEWINIYTPTHWMPLPPPPALLEKAR